jgi:DNA-binding MarR family transcriptional regulator
MRTLREGELRPTLWRTCRVLANRRRLRILQELFRRPGQSVTEVAVRLSLPVPLASRYLRELNARGLLGARRVGPRVSYRPFANPSVPQASPLIASLQRTFQTDSDPFATIFRLATAFTHPRRVELAAALASGPVRVAELGRRTGISKSALKRHVAKLRSRGFVCAATDGLALATPPSRLAAALLLLAKERP